MGSGMFMSNTELSRRRVFGVGIVATGIVLLAIALIMGLQFPEYVRNSNIEDLCILDSLHPKYNTWVDDDYKTRYNRIYYWQVTNKDDFLYNGAFPQFTLRGPYIYSETQEKVNVKFLWTNNHNIVQFYEKKQQEYQRSMTQQECGPDCTQYDQITVFNEKYFREISQFKTDTNFAWNKLPSAIQSCYGELLRLCSYNVTFMYETMASINQNLSLQLPDPSCRGFIPFGQWISLNDTATKQSLLSTYPAASFTASDMKGLYAAVMNQVLLGSDKQKLLDVTLQASCDHLISTFDLYRYLTDVQLIFDADGLLTNGEALSLQCGLAQWLQLYRTFRISGNLGQSALNVSTIIMQYLCVNSSSGCFNFPSTSHGTFTYTSAIEEYIYDHLLPFSIHKSVISPGNDVIITAEQNALALGYFPSNDNDSSAGTAFVPGILEFVLNDANVQKSSKHITLLNCYDQLYAQSNFMWYAYQHQQYSNRSQFPNASTQARQVQGIRENYPPLLDMSACGAHNVLRQNFTVFIPEFWRSMVFKRQEDCKCKIRGIRVNTFVFNESNVQKDDEFIFEDGIQDMSGTNGYLSWTSLPHFLFANQSLTSKYNAKPNVQQHLPNISIEPITGNVWGKSVKFQQNVGILPEYIEAGRFEALMINATNVPLPVYWLDQSFQYNSYGVEDHQSRVGSLMSASCGGLISLTIISILVISLGASIALCKFRSSRVAPAQTESENSMYYGTIW